MKNKSILILIAVFFSLSAYSQNILTDSLIAYYPFSGNAKDASGNGNNGTVYGATLTTDRFGNTNAAYSFNGTTDYIDYSPVSKFKPTTFPISITVWIKSNNPGPGAGAIFSNDKQMNIYSGYFLTVLNGTIEIKYGDGGATSSSSRRSKSGTININDNQWHFIGVVVRDSTDMDIYVDCNYDNNASYSGTGGPLYYSTQPGNSGIYYAYGSPFYYTGEIDDIRFYHRALTQTDLQYIYSYPKPYNNNLSVSLGPDTSFNCGMGVSVTLNPAVTGNVLSYQWSNSSSASSIKVNQAGNYAVTVYDGCRYAADTIAVTTNSGFTAGTLTSSRDSLCKGSGLTSTLTLSGSSGSLQWLSSTNGNNYSVISGVTDSVYVTPPALAQTSYYRVVVGSGSCADTSNVVVVHILPVPLANFTFGINGTQVAFNSAGSSSDVRTYSWNFGDSTVSTLASPTHTFTKKDTFYVCLTVYNGSNCSYTLCQDVNLVNTGINDISAQTTILIYPNPSSNAFNLFTTGLNGKYQLKIYNVLGQEMKHDELSISQSRSNPIDVNSMPQGTYQLILFNDKEYYNERLVISK